MSFMLLLSSILSSALHKLQPALFQSLRKNNSGFIFKRKHIDKTYFNKKFGFESKDNFSHWLQEVLVFCLGFRLKNQAKV